MRTKLVVLQPTSLCNLNCRYCYVPNRTDSSRMPDGVLEAVFSKILNSPLISERVEFLWHAGEPLTVGVDYFHRALRICEKHAPKDLEIKHTVQTNGVLINEKWCDFLVESNFSVGVSIDGPNFLHDATRLSWGGKGSFKSAVSAYKMLKNKGIDAGILSVLTAESLNYPDAIYEFYRSIDANWIAFNIEEVEGNNLKASTSTYKRPGIEQNYKSFIGRFFDRWSADRYPFRVREFDDFLLLSKPLLAGKEQYRRPDEVTPMTIVTVQKNGDISTFSPEFAGANSIIYNNFVIGNIERQSIREIVSSHWLKKITDDVEKGIRSCASTCKWFSLCGGGYVSNKFYENGSINSTETTACRLHRQMLSSVLIDRLSRLSEV